MIVDIASGLTIIPRNFGQKVVRFDPNFMLERVKNRLAIKGKQGKNTLGRGTGVATLLWRIRICLSGFIQIIFVAVNKNLLNINLGLVRNHRILSALYQGIIQTMKTPTFGVTDQSPYRRDLL